MKESEAVKEYSDRLLSIVNKDGMIEGALTANYKTQSKGNNSRKNYPPCQHCGKIGHLPFKRWKRPDAQCKICNQLGHEVVICKNKSQKYEAEAQVTKEDEENHLFVATFSTKKSDFWMIDSTLFKEFLPVENKKIRIGNGDYIPAKGKGNIAIKTVSGTKIISNVLYVPDIDKSLLSVGQLMEEGFKLLFGDKYCRIFNSTNHEILQVGMTGKSFLFNPTEDAHKSNKDELTDLFKRLNLAEAETIFDPRRSVSTSILRKYTGPVDIWLSLLSAKFHLSGVVHCFLNEYPRRSLAAMAQHKSQWVWFRKLFVSFSSYTYVNCLRKID
ncbi:putative TMV resistance protein N-like [Capsicum annuum]|nr:putative TMV resistance protein N-like [Capsicum annuum]